MSGVELQLVVAHDARVNKEDLAREDFIWKDLITRGHYMVKLTRNMWRKDRAVPRMLFSWPATHLHTSKGETITHLVSFAIPDGVTIRDAAAKLTRRTNAYALLLVAREGDDVKVILESAHGSRAWVLPVVRHGDVEVLEKEKASTDTEYIGILWRPSVSSTSAAVS